MAKESGNPKVKVVHFAVGLDLIGSKTSLTSTKYDIEATAIGIKAVSRASGRTIVVPYPNVKGFELLDEAAGTVVRSAAQSRADQAMAEARADEAKRGVIAQQAANQAAVPVLSDDELAEKAAEARRAAKIKARQDAEAQNAAQLAKK